MRLRLMDGGTELAVFEAASAAELENELLRVHGTSRDRLHAAEPLQVHLLHNGAWWNLSDDLSQFFTWIIEAGGASLDETRAFAAYPLDRPEWLFEAARQMKILLDVASEMQPQ